MLFMEKLPPDSLDQRILFGLQGMADVTASYCINDLSANHANHYLSLSLFFSSFTEQSEWQLCENGIRLPIQKKREDVHVGREGIN